VLNLTVQDIWMEIIKEKRILVIIISIALLCCILTSIIFIRQRNSNTSLPEEVPLSAIVLQPGDLPQSFLWTGLSPVCSQYLVLKTNNTGTAGVPSECYQVKYSLPDNSVIILNAIWKFANPELAEAEFNQAIEFMPSSGNMGLNVLSIPNVGDRSSGLLATINGGLSVISTYNLYWKYGATISRITIIGDRNTISQNDLIILARPVQARLEGK